MNRDDQTESAPSFLTGVGLVVAISFLLFLALEVSLAIGAFVNSSDEGFYRSGDYGVSAALGMLVALIGGGWAWKRYRDDPTRRRQSLVVSASVFIALDVALCGWFLILWAARPI
jgi:hypothetical protein